MNSSDADPDWPDGWAVTRVAETGSTNADLLSAAAAGAPDHSVIVADFQTAGRGRLDRRWEAPAGSNLLVSVLFRDVPDDPGEITRRIGVAAVAAVQEVAGLEALLKWPNDVLLGDRKLAGVLAQRAPDGSVVVGLGLNVRWAPEGAAMLGMKYRPLDVLGSLLVAIDALPTNIHERYVGLLDTLGRSVRVELPDGEIVGRAISVDRDGRLVVVDRCSISHRVNVGDIVHLRSAT